MMQETDEPPQMQRDFNMQVRISKFELMMLDDICAAYGLKRTDAIRRLIRDDWLSLTMKD